MSAQHHRVVIIGGGVIGVCTAYYLWKEGVDAAIIDQGEIGEGCSFGNAGLVCPSHFIPLAAPGALAQGLRWMLNPRSPFYIKPRINRDLFSWLWNFRGAGTPARCDAAMPIMRDMHLASVELFRGLTRLPEVDPGFLNNGLLMLFNSPKGRAEEIRVAERAHELGLPAEVLDTKGINGLDPQLRAHALGGVFYPRDCHLDPSRFVQSLAAYLVRQGAKMYAGAQVSGFQRDGRDITSVKTSRGEFTAEQFILAAGSWSPGVLRDLDITLPIQAAKGYSVTVKEPQRRLNIPLLLTEAKVAVTPMGSRLRFGGTLELAGMDLSINRKRVDALLDAVPRYLTGFNPAEYKSIEPWAGLRPCTPDGLPFIGRFPTVPNLIAATGHAMWGLSLGPITGKLVSELVVRDRTSLDLSLMRVDRFARH